MLPRKTLQNQEGTSSNTRAAPPPRLLLEQSHKERRTQVHATHPPGDTAQDSPLLQDAFPHPDLGQIYQSHRCRKTNLQKGKRRKKIIHIPHLKGRRKHRDMLLTWRYTLAHIPLTKMNILASVLPFTSSFSSHLNHYNHFI